MIRLSDITVHPTKSVINGNIQPVSVTKMKPLFLFSAAFLPLLGIAQVDIDFESPAYTATDSIDIYSGWQVYAGSGLVSTADALGGSQSLEMADYSGGGEATLAVSLSGHSVVFADLWIRPVVETLSSLGSALDLDGSGVRFVEDTTDALVEVLDGDQQGGAGTWLDVQSYTIDLDGVADSWMRVTLRQDFSSDTWDLYLDGELVAINVRLYDSVSGPALWTFYGAEDEPTYLDDLLLDDENPLFTDTSGDGIADSWLLAHGLDETLNHRTLDPDNDGLTTLEEYMLGKLPTVADDDGGTTDFYYVDSDIGSDSYNGLAAMVVGGSGPKETPGSALTTAATGSTILLLPGTGYAAATLDPDGKELRIKPVGNVIVEGM